MYSKWFVQRGLVMAAATFAAFLAVPGTVGAQQAKIVETLTATTTGLNPGAGENLKIDVLRWSTDEEAQKLLAAFKEKPDKWAETLTASPSVGYVWTASQALGYSVKYAQHSTLSTGGERIVLAIDRPLGSWDRQPWKPAAGSA